MQKSIESMDLLTLLIACLYFYFTKNWDTLILFILLWCLVPSILSNSYKDMFDFGFFILCFLAIYPVINKIFPTIDNNNIFRVFNGYVVFFVLVFQTTTFLILKKTNPSN